MIYDPEGVAQALEAGMSARISTLLGAKTDGLHGRPLEVEGRERVIVASKRFQSRDPEIFRAAGIDLLDTGILVVKSAVHFRAAFEPIASEVIVANRPGLTGLDLSQFDFKRIRRPIFPLDEI